MSLKNIADLPPEEVAQLDWEFVHKVLVDAQNRFEEVGQGRQSWMDGAIDTARARSQPVEPEPLWCRHRAQGGVHQDAHLDRHDLEEVRPELREAGL